MSQLFSELKLGDLTLENRIVVPPMSQYMASDGLPGPWHDMHLGTMGFSGAGLVILEATAVEDIGRISPNCLGLYNDEQESALRGIVDRIKTYSNVKWGVQLAHAGRKASNRPFDSREPTPIAEGGWQPIGPSPIPPSDAWPVPVEVTADDIDRIIACFAASAQRADKIGIDAIEVHGAHGYLISSFLSPLANQRSDRYGGSLENRMRLAIEIAIAIRNVWPGHKALGFRLNGTDWAEGGIMIGETVHLAKALREVGVDFVSVSSGGNSRQQNLPAMEPGYQVPLAKAVKHGSGLATMSLGLIVDPQHAESIIANGEADLVGVARATIDDPRWGLHAAQALGEEPHYPRSWWRVAGKYWPGYKFVHLLAHPLKEADWR